MRLSFLMAMNGVDMSMSVCPCQVPEVTHREPALSLPRPTATGGERRRSSKPTSVPSAAQVEYLTQTLRVRGGYGRGEGVNQTVGVALPQSVFLHLIQKVPAACQSGRR